MLDDDTSNNRGINIDKIETIINKRTLNSKTKILYHSNQLLNTLHNTKNLSRNLKKI